MNKILFSLIFLLCAISVYGVDIPLEFEDIEQQQRYQTLLEELRCLVCQNQSLAESHAPLAQDLRSQVFTMVSEGQPNEAIIDFLVARYGDFVLYRPPLNAKTLLLWFGPFLLLLLALVVVYRFISSATVGDVEINQQQRSKLSSLLDESGTQNQD